MPVSGYVSLSIGDRLVTLPLVPIAYANLDAPRAPGGFFIDGEGHLGIAVDLRQSPEAQQAQAQAGAREAYTLLSARGSMDN